MKYTTNRLHAFSFVLTVLFGATLVPNNALGSNDSHLPNIVIIYADDMGHGDLACQNVDSKIPTPNLDRLAADGMRFTNAHSSSGICTPSRYALLTGRYHWRKLHGIARPWEGSVFDHSRLTLPEMLRSQGYRTACIGKWHLGFDWNAIVKPGEEMIKSGRSRTWAATSLDWSKPIPDGPLAHGFDHYFGDDVPNFPPYTWIENDRVIEPPTEPWKQNPKPDEGSSESRPGPMVAGWDQSEVMPTLTEHAVQWIEEQAKASEPFFLYWAWTSPHAPIVPTDDWKGKSSGGPYGDFLTQSDSHAGELLRALEENGLEENTIVVFSSDNGPEHYAYERVRKYQHHSSGELRGLKRHVWEGGHRVPMIVRWPGVIDSAQVSDQLISQIDLMATFAEVVGFDLPVGSAEDSHSQLGHWKGGPSPRRSVVHNTYADQYAVRQGDWLLIDGPDTIAKRAPKWFVEQMGYVETDAPQALYNLKADIGQKMNRFADHPQLVSKLNRLLAETKARGEIAERAVVEQ